MKAKQVLNLLKITRPTLSKYVKDGRLSIDSEVNGQYNYNDQSVFALLNRGMSRKNIAYCRVSSSNQKQDLENQIQTVSSFMAANGITVDDVFSDISSGMNLDRKNFKVMLDQVLEHKIDTIYVTYKDRLTRVSFEMISKLIEANGTRIVVISDLDNPKTNEQEFLEEVVTLIHSYSMKMYSKRRKDKLALVAKDLELEQMVKL